MKNLFLYFYILLSITVFAQPDKYWLHKYWAYRERFNEQFVRVGSGRGMSIPVQSRANKGEATFPNGSSNDFAATGRLYFGDCTSHWGYYVGMLATEYGLLYNNGHYADAQQTLEELAYALLAFDRLDCTANGSIDGFFLRDDADNSTGALFALPSDPPAYSSGYGYKDVTLSRGVYYVQVLQKNSFKTIKLVVL